MCRLFFHSSLVFRVNVSALAAVGEPDKHGDGVINQNDFDDDNDRLLDIYEGSGDSAGDDKINVTDLDSDYDGLRNSVEASETSTLLTDLDQNNDVRLDFEVGSNGFVELLESTLYSGTSIFIVADSDQDEVPGFLDVDSDNDSFYDLVESNKDADGDAIADFRDLDSNGDAVFDITESGVVDTNMNGRVDSLDDADDDTLPNGVDVDFTSGIDTDNDGIDDMADVSLTGGPEGSLFGCSTSSTDNKDPALLILLGAAFAWLSLRKRKVRNLLAVLFMSLAVTACGSLDMGSFGGDAEIDRRVYIGVGGLASDVEPRSTDDNFDILETESAGYTVQLGYDVSNRLSIEGHYSDLGEAELSQDATIAYQVGGLSAIVYALNDEQDRARREGFSVFGRLGVGTMRNQSDGVTFKRLNDAHLLAGLGIEYGMSNGLGVRAELVSHEADAKYGQLGLVYRFGGSDRHQPAVAVAVPEEPAVPEATPTPAPVTPVIIDGDNDGVADARDQCPDTAAGLPVDSVGCDELTGAIEGVNFESGSDQLTAGAQQILAEVAQTLNQYPQIRVSVAAHTDNQGPADSNLQLSKRRAIAVARFLVEQGVAGNRLQPQAYGESQPLATNATASGRATNRRVELQVVQ